jgi:hypothetical protein
MKKAKERRERLFKSGKPTFRPAVYNDIRWLWVASKRAGFDGTSEEFSQQCEPRLAQADRLFMVEDRNKEFESGNGPVAVVLANYDGWTLCPHVEWFPWATNKNKLRCTVGFLQAMRYTHSIGCIKIFADGQYSAWFKWLRRYVAISLVGRIPSGRPGGEECIFYLRGRQNGRTIRRRREQTTTGTNISETTGSNA